MPDHLTRVLSLDGTLRACAAETTGLVEEIRKRQRTDPTATVAIGRLATGAALMSSLLKGRQRLGLIIEGNGPLKKLQAEANAAGDVRAKVKNPGPGLPPKNGRFDVAGAVGQAGFLHVIKDLGLKEPYRGMVQLQTSEVAEDLAYYFSVSEQTPSSVAIGVELGAQFEVSVAGGFMLQLMPETDLNRINVLEERLALLPPTTSLLREGCSPSALLADLLEGIPYQVLAETPLRFSCLCSPDQSGKLLQMLGAEDLDRLLAEQGEATVTCEYCKQSYHFDRTALAAIKASLES
ncbi:MAG: Hsp33 family molecular chaperone HslO [Deltaproteobacteria bacterium]|jgi:molecular chaperone Hsp33|nr:Hsp33 family molecular chaperone HslO [Deltaproteobacteria bacterium]